MATITRRRALAALAPARRRGRRGRGCCRARLPRSIRRRPTATTPAGTANGHGPWSTPASAAAGASTTPRNGFDPTRDRARLRRGHHARAWPAAASCASGSSSPTRRRSRSRPASPSPPGPTTAASPARRCARARASACASASATATHHPHTIHFHGIHAVGHGRRARDRRRADPARRARPSTSSTPSRSACTSTTATRRRWPRTSPRASTARSSSTPRRGGPTPTSS